MIEAVFNGQVVAHSDSTVVVDGNHYFPPEAVQRQFLHRSRTRSLCPWKGVASYYTVEVDGVRDRNAAWTYRHPSPLARRIKNHVAFGHGVRRSGYVHGHHSSILRTYDARTAANSAGYLLGSLRAGLSLLDVGCGAGSITADLAEQVAPGPVLGVDTSREALAKAAELAGSRGIDNVEFRVADVQALDLDDDRFDVVHAHQVLQHTPDPVVALREMRRVCRPGGLVAARDADYAAMTWYPSEPALDDWLSLYRQVAHATGGQPDAGRRLLSWAREAGFTDVTTGASTWCYATPESRQLWGGSWAERVLHSGIAERALSTGAATRADLERISAGWLRWSAAEDGWFGILHGEILCRA